MQARKRGRDTLNLLLLVTPPQVKFKKNWSFLSTSYLLLFLRFILLQRYKVYIQVQFS